jgi:uncharacterized protein
MSQLAISLAILVAAPWIYFSARYFQRVWRLIDKALMLIILALVLGHLLPESFHYLGFITIFYALAGLVLPSLLERMWSKNAGRIHFIPVILAITGLCFHGVMDGAALVSKTGHCDHCHLHSHSDNGLWLQLAVILHRLPDALFLWGVFYPKKGPKFASFLLFALGAATVVGYFLGEQIFALINHDSSIIYAFQAIVAGSLLHIAIDSHDHFHHHEDGTLCTHKH